MIQRVCAIVPTYNRFVYLQECLDSLLKQTRKIDEILVIDDGSSDETPLIESLFADKIKYLRKENAGKASALNLALKHTNADYIWICDDDDIAKSDALEILLGALEKNNFPDYIVADFMKFEIDMIGEKKISSPDFFKRSNEEFLNISFLEDMFTFQFAMLFKKSIFDHIGGFNEDLKRSQDYEMTLRISRKFVGVHVPEVIFFQRSHDGVRGPGGKIVTDLDREISWQKYDQIIFNGILESYSDDEFLPSFAKEYDAISKNACCLLEKSLVLAKRGLWTEASPFLHATSQIDCVVSNDEIRLCENMFRSSLVWQTLAKNENALNQLRSMLSLRRGKILLYSMCRSFRWMIKLLFRERKYSEALNMASLLLRILGIRLAVRRLLT